jgi:hypothetical protein
MAYFAQLVINRETAMRTVYRPQTPTIAASHSLKGSPTTGISGAAFEYSDCPVSGCLAELMEA